MNDSRRASHFRASDLPGAARLAMHATLGLTSLVENLHHNILRTPKPLGATTHEPAPGITGFVYRSIRGVTRLVGSSADAALGLAASLLERDDTVPSAGREAVLAALNGVIGDHLAETSNPLALPMTFRHGAQVLKLDRDWLAAALPHARGRVLLLLHGLCMSPTQWNRRGRDPAPLLAEEGGYTALHGQYNSGLPIAENGRLLADRLQALQDAWPVPLEELAIIGHSMGGLVARSAFAQAQARGDAWPATLRRLVFIGTPHRGAPLERGGHGVDLILGASPYTAAFSRLGRSRSAGIMDLRHGQVLAPQSGPVPLPEGVECFAIAGTLGERPGALEDTLLGDGLVPLDSALGRGLMEFAADHRFVARGVGHIELMDHPAVLAQLRGWLID